MKFAFFRHCIKNINDERVFIILYAVSAVYFAGVMVRLMLTLTPCVCVLAGQSLNYVSYVSEHKFSLINLGGNIAIISRHP